MFRNFNKKKEYIKNETQAVEKRRLASQLATLFRNPRKESGKRAI